MKVKIEQIAYYLPQSIEDMEILKRDNPDWNLVQIFSKTGIKKRHIASSTETAVDLAEHAALNLLARYEERKDIDLLILVTQSPDYVLPTSACILQNRLNLSKNCMAFDLSLGCSGFIYALSVASSLIETGVSKKALILCSDTYSKYISIDDRTCRPIFSDGAAATLLAHSEIEGVGPFEFGSDGAGFDRLIVKNSGARLTSSQSSNHNDIGKHLEMAGSDVFLFTMREIPPTINKLLAKTKKTFDDIALVIFHQASKLVIDNLIRSLKIDKKKVFTNYENIGNTVSASIPIALKDADDQGLLKDGDQIMLVGFGVGLSWGVTFIRWSK